MKKGFLFLQVFFLAGLAGCTSLGSVSPTSGNVESRPGVQLTQNESMSAETLGVGAALLAFGHPVSALGLPGEIFTAKHSALLYVLYDPLAPNWPITERPFGEDTVHVSLRAKHFRTGGDGEALQIVKRRALQLQRERGYSAYRVLDYSEGIESSTPFTYKVSQGTIQLVRGP